MKRIGILTIAVLAGVLAPYAAQGEIIYGINDNGSRLVQFDTDTLTGSELGVTGFSGVGGLAFGNNGLLYGLAADYNALITIDINTGAGTVVGSLGMPVRFSTGLANDPITDTLYGVSSSGSGMSSLLINISKDNGAAASIGDTTAQAIVGMSFDASGQLWAIDGAAGFDGLIKIDKNTAAVQTINPNALPTQIGCFVIGSSGTFWAIDSSPSQYRLLSIDSSTGLASEVGYITGIQKREVLTGLAVIPEPAGIAMIGLFTAGTWVKRRFFTV